MKLIISAMLYLLIAGSISGIYTEGKAIGEDDPVRRAEYELRMLADPNTGKIPENIRSRELDFVSSIPARDRLPGKGPANETLGANWVSRGPANLGGRTRALAIDVKNHNVMLAGGVSGGMWRSIDGGQSWARTTTKQQTPSVSCITQDKRPGKENVWYYGTGEAFGNSAGVSSSFFEKIDFNGDGIFRSVDNGISWEQIPSTVSGSPQKNNYFDFIWEIVTDPSKMKSDVILVAAQSGIFRSSDGGDSWKQVLGPKNNNINNGSMFTDIAVTPGGIFYAYLGTTAPIFGNSDKFGLYMSDDGESWTEITPSNFDDSYQRGIIEIDPNDEDTVYFFTRTNEKGQRTSDGRYTLMKMVNTQGSLEWTDLSNSIPKEYNGQFGYDMTLKVQPGNSSVIMLGGTNVYRSTDGFTSAYHVSWVGGYNPQFDFVEYNSWDEYEKVRWVEMTMNGHWVDQHAFVFNPDNPNEFYTGCDGGVFKTGNIMENSVKWVPLNNGYYTTQFYTVAINKHEPGNKVIIGGMQDRCTYGTFSSATKDWSPLSGGDGSFCAIPADGARYYVSSQGAAIYRAKLDANLDLISLRSIETEEDDYNFLAPFVLDPNNNDIMYLGSLKQVWRINNLSKENEKENWQSLSRDYSSGNLLTCLSISEKPANILYYSMMNYFSHKIIIYKLTDADRINFKEDIRQPLVLPSNGYLNNICIDSRDANKIIAVFSNYNIPSLFYSEDGGDSWTDISGNLEENSDGRGAGPSCRWAEILHRNGRTVYFIGTSTGLYSTTELKGRDTEWLQEGANSIGNVVVTMITARQSDGYIAVATHGNGVYDGNYNFTGVSGEPVPGAFQSDEPYPNPAKTFTAMKLLVPHRSYVEIDLYGRDGRKIRAIEKALFDEGAHNIRIPLDGISAGAYYIKVSAEDYYCTRMIIKE